MEGGGELEAEALQAGESGEQADPVPGQHGPATGQLSQEEVEAEYLNAATGYRGRILQ